MTYTKENRKEAVENFWRRRDEGEYLSVRTYAALIGIPYYTFRDWYRDPRYNGRFFYSRVLNSPQVLKKITFVEVK